MKFILLLLPFLVACVRTPENSKVRTGECIRRVQYGTALFSDERKIVNYGDPIIVTKPLEHGFIAEAYDNVEIHFQESGATAYQYQIRELYRSYNILNEYIFVDCESMLMKNR